ncbi:3-keto-5-aminohexanoate cleavage protein [Longimicrobium terrae]|uniref:Uncharacterized protein (DUF849 family) n=1 Tax=Longimicrobium terrae TaxID=1639882 RepID=A0A841GVG1_9BACT|nr:3-keto-5-aminohexanoate cleavage protein [Longimicrobium terrae]MBB4634325.1 uncharacterized protein (DUF849 family) [Longimicrobium terrae]MBB6068785.1 uncharacterized protein (DUF849 family) [Longimicrobium terrae]NNC27969.1 hypothetical protein [Longimicrobium terrae]
MFLKAALNGARSTAYHPRVPITAQQLAADARAAVQAGADAIHLHVRGEDGMETLAGDELARTLAAVRASIPGTPVGVTSRLPIVGSPAERLRLARGWTALPDFVSVNFDEEGSPELAELLLARGVGVEAGLADADAARALLASGLSAHCLRILIEPREEDVDAARATVSAIDGILSGAGAAAPRVVHGVDATAWPLLNYAGGRGWGMRIGFEDTRDLMDGSPAADNAALVLAARALLSSPLCSVRGG